MATLCRKELLVELCQHLHPLTGSNLCDLYSIDPLLASFRQLTCCCSFLNGLINRLPTEIFERIFVYFEVQELIHLRGVCLRWNALIEMVCTKIGKRKRSLILYAYEFDEAQFVKRFFGQVNVRDFVRIKLKKYVKPGSKFQARLGAFLVRIIPTLEKLVLEWSDLEIVFKLWPANQLTTLSLYNHRPQTLWYQDCPTSMHGTSNTIYQMSSLKCLDLCGRFYGLSMKLRPIIAHLEHFSYQRFNGYQDKDELVELFGRFKPNTTRVWFDDGNSTSHHCQINHFHSFITRVKSDWLSSLTHLSIKVLDARFIMTNWGDHFKALQVLIIQDNQSHKFSLLFLAHFVGLAHLTELQLGWYDIDMSEWEPIYKRLTPFPAVRSVTLNLNVCRLVTGDRLSRLLSTIFPNVQHLTIRCIRTFAPGLADIEQHWNRFPNLISHQFKRASSNLDLD